MYLIASLNHQQQAPKGTKAMMKARRPQVDAANEVSERKR